MPYTIHFLNTNYINPWLRPGLATVGEAGSTPAPATVYAPRGWRRRLKCYLRLTPTLAVVGLSALVVWFIIGFREIVPSLGIWAYLGVFLAELGNSAALLFPTPGPAYTFSIAVILNPLLVGLVGGIGAALGELTGYYLGAKGRRVIKSNRFYRYVDKLSHKRTEALIFGCAALPVPFDFVGLWAGTVNYPLHRFLACLMAGKIIKVTVAALAVSYGFHHFLGPLS